MHGRIRSFTARAAAGTMLAFGLLLLSGHEAAAHAELVETNPANGAHLDTAPREVTLRFTEGVSPVRDGLRLVDNAGRTVVEVAGDPVPGDSSRVTMPLPDDVGDGAYVVVWRVLSGDSHPVHGSFVFSVGAAQAAPLADAGAQTGADSAVGVAFWVVRVIGFAGLAALIGGAYFVLVCWPAGGTDRRVRRLIAGAWTASVAAAAGALLVQGPNVAGSSLASVLDPTLIPDTVGTSYGLLLLVRLAVLVVGAVVFTRPGRPSTARLAALGVLAVVLVLTWSGGGHAAAGTLPPLAMATDAIHLLAMSVWLGGLAVLATCLLSGRGRGVPDGLDDAADAVTRFSRTAGIAVVVLGATGIVQAWRELAASGVGTDYFTLLVFKVGVFGLLLWLGAVSRSVVRRQLAASMSAPEPAAVTASVGTGTRTKTNGRPNGRAGRRDSGRGPTRGPGRTGPGRRGGEADTLTALRRSVRWEVAIAAIVLGLTAALVATPPGGHDHGPAAAAATSTGPFIGALPLPGDGDVQVWVSPAQQGDNEIVINVRGADGINREVPGVSVELTLPDGDIGPLPVELDQTGKGQFVAGGVLVPVAGTWRLAITVRTSDFDQATVETDVAMRP